MVSSSGIAKQSPKDSLCKTLPSIIVCLSSERYTSAGNSDQPMDQNLAHYIKDNLTLLITQTLMYKPRFIGFV